MNIRKSFEAWFLREYGDGNFSRIESGEYADLAVRNYWGIWQGAWAALGEQSPAVPGCVMESSKQEALAIIRDIKSWDCDPERGLLSLPLELRQRMQAALESTQPAEQRPAVPEGWQPMETAPKDGSRILLRDKDGGAADGQWVAKAYAGNGAWVWPFVHREPTHWMPLPVLLSAQPAEQQPDVAGLVEALEEIAASRDSGRHDGLPEEGPALDDVEAWLVARAALAAYREGGE